MKVIKNIIIYILFLFQAAVLGRTNSTLNHDVEKQFEKYCAKLYNECGLTEFLSHQLFRSALIGYLNMRCDRLISEQSGVVIIDYTLSANKKRFFVIDLKKKKLIYNTLVAHGRNSGNKKAEYFSNEIGSKKSCIGFFITGKTYYGKHGYSLSLVGLDSLYNDNVQKRSIVIHGAEYVSKDFINRYGRIGRSWGCPVLPIVDVEDIVDTIKDGWCLFIFYNDKNYLMRSRYLRLNQAFLDIVE